MALIHFAATLFVSAFILFLVQPLIGKLVLPKLGGTPQVWNTCMVFFQMVLLLGYFYTHAVSTKLKARQQIILHSIVILIPFIIFAVRPFWFIKAWEPPLGTNPILPTLYLLTTVVGIPFFVVSTTAPLLQKWFGLTGHPASKDPYFLYGASNLGSMLSLLVYPALIEPFSYLNTQAGMWMVGYGVLGVMVFGCTVMIWKQAQAPVPAEGMSETPGASPKPTTGDQLAGAITSKPTAKLHGGDFSSTSQVAQGEKVDGLRRLKWIMWAAVPSSMMLGITSHITTDLSPIPLFWLVPLALYLMSFILVFARWPVVWVEGPHNLMVYIQPFAIAFMLFLEFVPTEVLFPSSSWGIYFVIIANVLGFFFTTMVCHGELAKDRPSTRYLTEFYLMMSVGGMLGGMLNAIIAPLFPIVFEFNAAIIAACLLRPTLGFGNWLDNLIAGFADSTPEPEVKTAKGGKGPKPVSIAKKSGPSAGLSKGLDIAMGIGVFVLTFLLITMFVRGGQGREFGYMVAYGVPLIIALSFMFRSLRFGLCIAGAILAHELYMYNQESGTILHRSRSYFGVIRVKLGVDRVENADKSVEDFKYTTLIHGHINHGMNYGKNEDPTKDYSRLATTYYHRKGPAGIVMEKFNWHKDPIGNNTFHADARMPAGLLAQGAFGALGMGVLPFGDLVEVWTEPPYATIGLGTGTMASYGRPFQHVHFYEIDDQIRRLSLPESGKGKAYFTYLQDAMDRGANVQVLMGDARQRMALPYANHHDHEKNPKDRPNGGPEKFYHMMVVDAFSSDAIPAHLLTKEAFEMYFKHLTEDGILCVHTSNRFVDLPLVVADVAASLDLVTLRGHDIYSELVKDNPAKTEKGHFTSEWVMVARKVPTNSPDFRKLGGERGYLRHLIEPTGYSALLRKAGRVDPSDHYWRLPNNNNGKYLWTDDYYNLLTILRVFVGRN